MDVLEQMMKDAGTTAPSNNIMAVMQADAAAEEPTPIVRQNSGVVQDLGNLAAGAVKGASNIGATLLSPIDYLAQKTGLQQSYPALFPEDRRLAVTQGLQSMGANPDAGLYKTGEIGTEIAGTAGAGGILAKGAELVPALAKFAPALASGGFNLGEIKNGMLANALLRTAAGSATGAVTAGMINPGSAPAGAIIGGVMPGAASVAGSLGKGITGFLHPDRAAVDILADSAGGAQQLADAVRNAQTEGHTISGMPFTLGQAGKNAGLAALERSRNAANPESFQQIYQAQRNARIDQLLNIAKDPETVQAAMEARNEAAKTMYNPAFEQTLMAPSSGIPVLNKLANNPVIQAAKKDAANLAASFPGNETLGDPMSSVKGLHYMKLAIDSQLSKPVANTALGSYSHAALSATKKSLMEAIDSVSPSYTEASSQYALASKPINQMQVGQKLLDTLVGPATQYGAEPGQRMAAFYRALENSPRLIKQETGMSLPLDKVLTPEQMTSVQKIAKELAKDVDLQNLGRGVGSDTAQKLAKQNMVSTLSSLATHNRLSRTAQAFNLAARLLREGKNVRTNSYIDTMLQNPDIAMQAAQQMNQAPSKLGLLLSSPTIRTLPLALQANP